EVCQRIQRPQPAAAGAGLSPAGGSLRKETSEPPPQTAAPETQILTPPPARRGPRGNQGFPRASERSEAIQWFPVPASEAKRYGGPGPGVLRAGFGRGRPGAGPYPGGGG